MARSKAYLFGGVEIRWACTKRITDETPTEARFHFTGGSKDLGPNRGKTESTKTSSPGADSRRRPGRWSGRCAGWRTRTASSTPIQHIRRRTWKKENVSVPHCRALSDFGERVGKKPRGKTQPTRGYRRGEMSGYQRPEFKANKRKRHAGGTRIVESTVRDAFDHGWRTPPASNKLLDGASTSRDRSSAAREGDRPPVACARMRLPASSRRSLSPSGTEIFIVEAIAPAARTKRRATRAPGDPAAARQIINVANAPRRSWSRKAAADMGKARAGTAQVPRRGSGYERGSS